MPPGVSVGFGDLRWVNVTGDYMTGTLALDAGLRSPGTNALGPTVVTGTARVTSSLSVDGGFNSPQQNNLGPTVVTGTARITSSLSVDGGVNIHGGLTVDSIVTSGWPVTGTTNGVGVHIDGGRANFIPSEVNNPAWGSPSQATQTWTVRSADAGTSLVTTGTALDVQAAGGITATTGGVSRLTLRNDGTLALPVPLLLALPTSTAAVNFDNVMAIDKTNGRVVIPMGSPEADLQVQPSRNGGATLFVTNDSTRRMKCFWLVRRRREASMEG